MLGVEDLDDKGEIFEVHLLDLCITIYSHNLIKESLSERGGHFLIQVLEAPKHLTQVIELDVLGIFKNHFLENSKSLICNERQPVVWVLNSELGQVFEDLMHIVDLDILLNLCIQVFDEF